MINLIVMENNMEFTNNIVKYDFQRAMELMDLNQEQALYLDDSWDSWGGGGIGRKLHDIVTHVISYESLSVFKWFLDMLNRIPIYDTAFSEIYEIEEDYPDLGEYFHLAISMGQEDIVKYLLTLQDVIDVDKTLVDYTTGYQMIMLKFFWRVLQEVQIEVQIPIEWFILGNTSYEALKWYHSVNPFTSHEVEKNIDSIIQKYQFTERTMPDKILGILTRDHPPFIKA